MWVQFLNSTTEMSQHTLYNLTGVTIRLDHDSILLLNSDNSHEVIKFKDTDTAYDTFLELQKKINLIII